MNAQLSRLLGKFGALTFRERALVMVVIFGATLALTDFFWVGPLDKEARTLRARMTNIGVESDALAKAAQSTAGQAVVRPGAPEIAERDRLRAAWDEAEAFIRRANTDVKLGEVVRMLTAKTPDVTLVSLRTLPSEPLGGAPAQEQSPPSVASLIAAATGAPASAPAKPVRGPLPPLYRHGVEVVLSGSYKSLVRYLQSLERATPGLYWGGLKLEVAQHPDCTMKVTLYTLSTRPEASIE